MPTVAIVGVASHFARAILPLLDADARIDRVIGLDVRPPATSSAKLEFHRCDVRDDPIAIAALLRGAEIVIHLAFVVLRKRGMPESEIDAINVQGTRNVCEAVALAGSQKLIIASSVAAYGAHPDNPPRLTEDAPLRGNPEVYYCRNKAENEHFLDRFQAQHPDIIITRFRPCTITSSEPQGTNAGMPAPFVPVMRGNNVPLQFLHDSDLARAFHMAVSQNMPGAYNVAPDDALPLADIAAFAGQRVLALPRPMVMGLAHVAWRTGTSNLSPEWVSTLISAPIVVANDKLKALGWKPTYTTAEAYKALIDGAK